MTKPLLTSPSPADAGLLTSVSKSPAHIRQQSDQALAAWRDILGPEHVKADDPTRDREAGSRDATQDTTRIDDVRIAAVRPLVTPALLQEELPVPAVDLIGADSKGFDYILHGLNPERILIAAEAIGLGRAALARAVAYAGERVVFDRPIGQNQAIQHPLARCWMELEAAQLMVLKAASLYDKGQPCGAEANAAKFLAAEACFRACETAMLTHGGMGYAKEYHIERYFREAMIPRLAPVSPQLILCFIAEKVLGLPKSY